MAASDTSTGRRSRKGEILQTFTQMVAERGYDDVSLRDSAEALGMSKGTIVHHFGSKDRLLEQLHAEYMRVRLAEARLIVARLDTPSERLAALIYQLLLVEADDRPATVAFAREIVRFQAEEVMQHVRQMRSEYFRIVRDVVADGMARGTFRGDEPALVTLQLFGMCNWSWTWLRVNGRWSIDQIARTFIVTFLQGVVVRDDEQLGLELESLAGLVRDIRAEVAETIAAQDS
jgi:TetR/AcrR family transcriptional regulator, cholesterol catabolism regulator